MPGATVDAPKTEADALANSAGKMLATTQAEFALRKLTPHPPLRRRGNRSLPTNSTKSTVP